MPKIPDCPELDLEDRRELRSKADEVITYHSFIYNWYDEAERYNYELNFEMERFVIWLERLDGAVDNIIEETEKRGFLEGMLLASRCRGEWVAYQHYVAEIPPDFVNDVNIMLAEYESILKEMLMQEDALP